MKKRKCLKCGKDPYPNRYYCKKCHVQVTRQEGWQEEHGAGIRQTGLGVYKKLSENVIRGW